MFLNYHRKIVRYRTPRDLCNSLCLKYLPLPSRSRVNYYPGRGVMINYKQYLLNRELAFYPGREGYRGRNGNVVSRFELYVFYIYGKFSRNYDIAKVIYDRSDGRNSLDLIYIDGETWVSAVFNRDVYFSELDMIFTYGCISSGIYHNNLHFQRCCYHLANISLLDGDANTISLLRTIHFKLILPMLGSLDNKNPLLLNFYIYNLYKYVIVTDSGGDRNDGDSYKLLCGICRLGNIYKYLLDPTYDKYDDCLKKGTAINLDKPSEWLKELMLDWFGVFQWLDKFSDIYRIDHYGCVNGLPLFNRDYFSYWGEDYIIEKDITISDLDAIIHFGLIAECLMPRFDCIKKYNSMPISDLVVEYKK